MNRKSVELKNALKALELPGDVWNNSDYIRKGLFSHLIIDGRKTWDIPKTIREVYNYIASKRALRFYPEQLDVSHDFVPRMCDRDMCTVCPFGGGIKRVCQETQGLYCPVALYSCGYIYECEPSACNLKKDRSKGYCSLAILNH